MEMQEYLAMKNDSNNWEEVACQWIKTNRPRWERWVPKDTWICFQTSTRNIRFVIFFKWRNSTHSENLEGVIFIFLWGTLSTISKETTCFRGFGLVDVAQKSVTSRSDAVGCGLCTPGTSSSVLLDNIGRTYTCKSCEPGSYQELSGETLCTSCPVGRIAREAGLSQCEVCPPGSFANSVGLQACQICGTGSLQWTTSRKVELHGSEEWITVEGAVSEDYCHCLPGYFLDQNQTCRECTEGASCPGSNQVELLPGYFSSSTDPGSIYRCYPKALACPGGLPGSCAVGRDNSSVACSACLSGLYSTDEGCVPCEGQDVGSCSWVLSSFGILGRWVTDVGDLDVSDSGN